MAYGDPQLLHVDKVLSQISVGYRNNAFVGDVLFPAVRVDKQSDKYLVQEKDGFTGTEDLRGPGAQTLELPPMTLSRDSFYAQEHALKDWVFAEEEENADPGIDALGRAARRVTDTILLNREVAIATIATTAANYATNHSVTLAGGDQWSTYATSDPIGDLKAARDQIYSATLKMPNVAILGYQVASMLEDHPAFLDRMMTTPLQNNNRLDAIGELTGLRLYRGAATRNTSPWGQTPAYSYLWGKDVVVAYVPDSPAKEEPAYGYEFVWPYKGQVMPTDRWFDQDRKSTAVRTTRRYDLKVAAVDTVASGKITAGYVIKAAVA